MLPYRKKMLTTRCKKKKIRKKIRYNLTNKIQSPEKISVGVINAGCVKNKLYIINF